MNRLKRTLVFGMVVGGSLFAQEKETDLAAMLEWSKEEIKRAEAELNAAREAIVAEKVPLIEILDTERAKQSELQAEKELASIAVDRSRGTLETLENEAREVDGDARLLSNLLSQFRREFERHLSLVDRERLEGPLLAYEGGARGSSRIDVSRAGWDLVDTATDLLAERAGGVVRSGTALVNGIESRGQFVSYGPYDFFRSEDSITVGVVDEGDDLLVRAFTVEGLTAEVFNRLASGEVSQVPLDPRLGEALQIESAKVSLVQHMKNGGYWMLPILGFGLVSYLLALWKAYELMGPKRLDEGALDAVVSRSDTGADRLGKLPTALRRVFEIGIQFARRPLMTREAAMRRPYLEYRHGLESKLSLVALTAAVAPLLGLLGTVTGMIKTFQLISIYGTGDAKSLSSGISEALVTTEFGLIVAIPALVAHAILQRNVKRQVSTVTAAVDAFNHSLDEGDEAK